MRATIAGSLAFGCTLALVVGLRLSWHGLLLLSMLWLLTLTIGMLLLAWWLGPGHVPPEVRVERARSGGLGQPPCQQLERLTEPPRRGDWPHLEAALRGWSAAHPERERQRGVDRLV